MLKGCPQKSQSTLKKARSIPAGSKCDNLLNFLKADPTNYVGSLSPTKRLELNRALKMALDL